MTRNNNNAAIIDPDKLGAPYQSYRWLRPFIPKKLQPLLRGLRRKIQLSFLHLEEPYKTVYPYTQVSMNRQTNLYRLSQLIQKEQIEGDLVECGVLDGGTAALMAFATKTSSRQIHLFDAWLGLPKTVEQDGEASKKWIGQVVGSPKRVIQVMNHLSIDMGRVHFYHGWFEDTFPKTKIEKIALLHVDCDFFEPTSLCIQKWYLSIVSGGYIQFDDYASFEGCTKAVDGFLQKNPELELQTFGNIGQGEAYYIRKP